MPGLRSWQGHVRKGIVNTEKSGGERSLPLFLWSHNQDIAILHIYSESQLMLFDCLHQKAAVEIIAVELSRQYDQGHIGTRLDGFLLDGFFRNSLMLVSIFLSLKTVLPVFLFRKRYFLRT